MALDLINNRTASDVANAKRIISKVQQNIELTESEYQEFYNGLRGAYNTSDVNRVMSAMEYITNFINSQGYAFKFEPWQEWDNNDIFNQANWQDYLNRIKMVRQYLPLPESIPQAPTTLFVSQAYQRANDIETILLSIENYIVQMINGYLFLDDVELGEI